MDFISVYNRIDAWDVSTDFSLELAKEYIWSKLLPSWIENILLEKIQTELQEINTLESNNLKKEKLRDFFVLLENLDLDCKVFKEETLDEKWNVLSWDIINKYLWRIEKIINIESLEWRAVKAVELVLSENWEKETFLASWEKPFYIGKTKEWSVIKFGRKWLFNDVTVVKFSNQDFSKAEKLVKFMNLLLLSWDSEDELKTLLTYVLSENFDIDEKFYSNVLLEQAERVEIYSPIVFLDIIIIATRGGEYDKISYLISRNAHRLNFQYSNELTSKTQNFSWIIPELINSSIDREIIKIILLLYRNSLDTNIEKRYREFAMAFQDDQDFMKEFNSIRD